MTAIEVSLDGKKLCVAGIKKDGLLLAQISWFGRGDKLPDLPDEEVALRVSGIDSKRDEHVYWVERDLKIGDEVVLRIVNPRVADKPKKRKKVDRKTARRRQEAYVRRLVKDLGWKISEQPSA